MAKPRIFDRADRLRMRLRRSPDQPPKGTRVRMPRASGIVTRGSTKRGSMLRPTPRWHQRVTVKITYRERYGVGEKADKSFATALKKQVRYNTRTDAKARAEGVDPVRAFDAGKERLDAHAAVSEWSGDRRYWKIIISPERGNDMKDFPGYIREVMGQVERDVLTEAEIKRGLRLEWTAAIHDDTDHRHAHVLMRGSIEGRDLVLSRPYLSHGIRARASEIATRHLGYRLGEDSPAWVDDAEGGKQQAMEKDKARGMERPRDGWGIG